MGSLEINERISFYEIPTIHSDDGSALRNVVVKTIDGALTRFYSKISRTAVLSAHFKDEKHADRARNSQKSHWLGVFTDGVTEAYAARALAIGEVHARIGLEPKWYIGGYSIVLDDLIHQIITPGMYRFLPWRRSLARKVALLVKVALLDIDLGVCGYFANSEEKVRSVVRDQLGVALAALAKGDLAARSAGLPDEYRKVEEDFNSALDALCSAMGEVKTGVNAISCGAGEIRSAAEDLARRTEQQAANLEETAAAIKSVTAEVQEAAKGVSEARTSMALASREAGAGTQVIGLAMGVMGDIESSSKLIGQIIGVIDGIAFQTNLLALNAGVEAARAGEAGKGFAVVASEVRSLAQRCAEAAKEVKELITTSANQVSAGVSSVREIDSAFSAIAKRILTLQGLIDGIGHSAMQQAAQLQQIDSSVGSIDLLTQQNAAMAEECSAAASALAGQAEAADSAMRRFNLISDQAGTYASAPTWRAAA